MVEIWLPYGRTEAAVNIADENFAGEMAPKYVSTPLDPSLLAKNAIMNPVGTTRLKDLAKGRAKVAIAIDQSQDPSFNVQTLLAILEELTLAGVDRGELRLIIAKSLSSSVHEDLPKVEALDPSQMIVHDRESERLVSVGETGLGTGVAINEAFASSDFRIVVGYSMPSGLCGFSGVPSVVLPGLSGPSGTSHSWSAFDDPRVKLGTVEGNPIRADMLEAAKLAGIGFAVNGIPNREGRIVHCLAGDLEEVDTESLSLCRQVFPTPVEKSPGIVIASAGGYPFDCSLQTASMCLENACAAVRRDGGIIAVCECSEGVGSREFVEWGNMLTRAENPSRELRRKFRIEGYQALQVVKAAERTRVALVSILPDYYANGIFKLKTSRTINEALKSALSALGKGLKVATMPYGALTVPVIA